MPSLTVDTLPLTVDRTLVNLITIDEDLAVV